MENDKKTREPLDDDALGEVTGGYTEAPGWSYDGAFAPMPGSMGMGTFAKGSGSTGGGSTGSTETTPKEKPFEGGWKCTGCGSTYSGLSSRLPGKCIFCGGEWKLVGGPY